MKVTSKWIQMSIIVMFIMNLFFMADLKKVKTVEKNGEFVIKKGVLLEYKGTKKKITIPKKVKTIGKNAFKNNIHLERVVISKNVKKIGKRAFYACNSLKEVKISGSVKKIEKEAFQFCKKLTKIILGEGIKEIGNHAFADCKELKTVILPDSMEKIGRSAFAGCAKLEDLVVLNSETKIGKSAFSGCPIQTVSLSLSETMAIRENIEPEKNSKVQKETEEIEKSEDKKEEVKKEKETETKKEVSLEEMRVSEEEGYFPEKKIPEKKEKEKLSIKEVKAEMITVYQITEQMDEEAKRRYWMKKLPKQMEVILSDDSKIQLSLKKEILWEKMEEVKADKVGNYVIQSKDYDLPDTVGGEKKDFVVTVSVVARKMVVMNPILKADEKVEHTDFQRTLNVNNYTEADEITYKNTAKVFVNGEEVEGVIQFEKKWNYDNGSMDFYLKVIYEKIKEKLTEENPFVIFSIRSEGFRDLDFMLTFKEKAGNSGERFQYDKESYTYNQTKAENPVVTISGLTDDNFTIEASRAEGDIYYSYEFDSWGTIGGALKEGKHYEYDSTTKRITFKASTILDMSSSFSNGVLILKFIQNNQEEEIRLNYKYIRQ